MTRCAAYCNLSTNVHWGADAVMSLTSFPFSACSMSQSQLVYRCDCRQLRQCLARCIHTEVHISTVISGVRELLHAVPVILSVVQCMFRMLQHVESCILPCRRSGQARLF